MSGRIGYLVPEFPGQTHTWIWRELLWLRRWGADVRLISTRPPPERDRARHAFAAAAAETFYLYRPAAGELGALLGAVARRSATHPRAVANAIRLASSLPVDASVGRRRCLALLAPAARLAALLRAGRHHARALPHLRRRGDRRHAGPSHGRRALLDHHQRQPRLVGRGAGGEARPRRLHRLDHALGAEGRAGPFRACDRGPVPLRARRGRHRRMATGTPAHAPAPASRCACSASAASTGARASTLPCMPCARCSTGVVPPGSRSSAVAPSAQALAALAAELGLGTHVDLAGSMPEDEVRRALADADIFLLPSHAEPLGVVVMEAMAMGRAGDRRPGPAG